MKVDSGGVRQLVDLLPRLGGDACHGSPDVEEVTMSTSTTRVFTRSRVVALMLIALLVGGLVYLRFAPNSDTVSVPEDAKPGDLVLQPCDFKTENGSYAADCGTLVVPEKRADPQSRLIALPVTRILARSDHPGSRFSSCRAALVTQT
jgi:hypothetical protein